MYVVVLFVMQHAEKVGSGIGFSEKHVKTRLGAFFNNKQQSEADFINSPPNASEMTILLGLQSYFDAMDSMDLSK